MVTGVVTSLLSTLTHEHRFLGLPEDSPCLFSSYLLSTPALRTWDVFEKVNWIVLLLSSFRQTFQRFPTALRCKLKCHIGLRSPPGIRWHHVLLLVSGTSDSLLPQNLCFCSPVFPKTSPTARHPHSTPSLPFLPYSNAPFRVQLSGHFRWLTATFSAHSSPL